ncbi:hypothetical protein SB847_09290 [Bacillus sp. SIMBA_026]|uniref:hypothetical protein n=1 Tax=Bacillus sp. SIMBA_026 TaxID=3085769 RepID=UPI003978EB02
MKEYKINFSNDVVFHRDAEGKCSFSFNTKCSPFVVENLQAIISTLAEEVIIVQAMNREHQRQQEVTVHQFQQAQEEIQRLQLENGRFKEALLIYADENKYRRTMRMAQWATVEMENRYGDFNPSFMEVDRGQTAREALEGDAE